MLIRDRNRVRNLFLEMEVQFDKGFPRVKKKLWGGPLWEQRDFCTTIGEQATEDVIRNFIEHHS
jgi:hypothetical protein